MKPTLEWLTDPEVFAVNREEAHSDHDCYVKNSFLRQNLNGAWRFAYADKPADRICDFYRNDYSVEDFDVIQVPGHIQLQGYDQCQYVNAMYPWEGQEQLRPPLIPEQDNPVGSYVRFFDVDKELFGKEIYLSFQGVETAFYVWLNGEFVGYSEDSFTPAEFRITSFLKEKGNKLAVEVYKRSSASWLEDQDFWRFSGIFRDVYLYAVPGIHVRDMKITADYDDNTGEGTLAGTLDIVGEQKEPYEIRVVLKDSAGAEVFHNRIDCISGNVLQERVHDLANDSVVLADRKVREESKTGETVAISKTISHILPWSAEAPNLYTLTVDIVSHEGEVIETAVTKVGFRTFALKNGVMCLNGKRIIFKGVNRHEFHPERGRAITKEDMLYDILLLKQNNINAVRTCHYPNQSEWYRLCDKYGIYLIDETNLETHGTWQKMGMCEPSWNVPGSCPEWREAVLDRARSMYERDKNHPSVLIWSCGNESYCGDDIAAMADYFHRVDKGRLVHYEGVVWNRDYDHITDMESRMYAKPAEVEEYLKQNIGKPYISCEYMHAMGNSLGGMHLYTELEDKYEAYQGGFIWDYIDQAIIRTDETGREVLCVGGDFDDRPSDYGFCTNGIVYADRTPSPKVQEVKALYANLKLRIAEGVLYVENKNLFTDTGAYVFKVILEKEGVVLGTRHYKLDIPAGGADCVKINMTLPKETGEYVYTATALLEEDTIWAKKGHEIAFAQEITEIRCSENSICSDAAVKPRIVYGDFCIGVQGEQFSMIFDRQQGGISSLKYHGEEYLIKCPLVSFWRALTDNDTGAGYGYEMAQWRIAGGYAKYRPDKLTWKEEANSLIITFVYTAPTVPAFTYKVIYQAYYDGRLGVRVEYPGVKGMADMPVMALDFQIKKQYSRFTYYGLGPEENYIDRCSGARLGVFSSAAEDNLSRYLNPQECGGRTGVRYVKVHDSKGNGIQFAKVNEDLQMSVLPHSAYELEEASHMEELPEVSATWVRIAAKQMGVGGDDSWGAPVHQEYKINAEQPIILELIISAL